MSARDECPLCGADLRGDEIPEKYRQHQSDHDQQVASWGRCHCLPYGDKTHFSRVIGHEVRGVYDGILFWSCPDCGQAWPRWTDGGRLTEAAAVEVARFNSPYTSPASDGPGETVPGAGEHDGHPEAPSPVSGGPSSGGAA